MYNAVLALHILTSLLICVVTVMFGAKTGGARDFTSESYSADSLFAPRYANKLIVKLLSVLGFIFFFCSISMMLLREHHYAHLSSDIAATTITKDIKENPPTVKNEG